jgi:uncharacterized tellurite resistance protein B-like protein
MREEALKATYINLLLLASADGRVDPSERAYLKRFVEAFGVSEDLERRWAWEMSSRQTGFLSIENRDDAEEALALLSRMVRVDGEFGEAEQDAYVAMGKAMGFTPAELGPVLRAHWNEDPPALADKKVHFASGAEVDVLVMADDIGDRAVVERAAAGASLRYAFMVDLPGSGEFPDIVLFHAAEDREDSKRRLEALRERFPEAFIAFIARRDQSPQIGWLLGLGAGRCFVEPLYPDEIGRAIGKMK